MNISKYIYPTKESVSFKVLSWLNKKVLRTESVPDTVCKFTWWGVAWGLGVPFVLLNVVVFLECWLLSFGVLIEPNILYAFPPLLVVLGTIAYLLLVIGIALCSAFLLVGVAVLMCFYPFVRKEVDHSSLEGFMEDMFSSVDSEVLNLKNYLREKFQNCRKL